MLIGDDPGQVGVSQGGGWSAPTAAVSTSAGPATLSTNNNLLLSWTGAANDIAYLIYSCSGASCTPTLHAVMPHAGAPGATAESYRDFGHSFGNDEDFGTAMRSSGAGWGPSCSAGSSPSAATSGYTVSAR